MTIKEREKEIKQYKKTLIDMKISLKQLELREIPEKQEHKDNLEYLIELKKELIKDCEETIEIYKRSLEKLRLGATK